MNVVIGQSCGCRRKNGAIWNTWRTLDPRLSKHVRLLGWWWQNKGLSRTWPLDENRVSLEITFLHFFILKERLNFNFGTPGSYSRADSLDGHQNHPRHSFIHSFIQYSIDPIGSTFWCGCGNCLNYNTAQNTACHKMAYKYNSKKVHNSKHNYNIKYNSQFTILYNFYFLLLIIQFLHPDHNVVSSTINIFIIIKITPH
jgi:hypothetical protein